MQMSQYLKWVGAKKKERTIKNAKTKIGYCNKSVVKKEHE